MFRISFIIFREILEIALLLSIITAVTKKVSKSRIYIITGVICGIVAASLFAFFAKAISVAFSGVGDEIFNSIAISLTVVTIIFTIVLMQDYSKKISKDLDDLSTQINSGVISRIVLISVTASSVFREAIEIMLYLYSISSLESVDMDNYLLGFAIGVVSGSLVGITLYLGFIKINTRYIFKISSILLTLIAASLSSEVAGILTSSGIIEDFSDELWDTSSVIDDRSNLGRFLNAFIGYTARPNGMQIIYYISTILFVLTTTILYNKLRSKSDKSL